MSPRLSRLAARPYRSEEQARREREAKETHAAPQGIAEALGSAVAFYAAAFTFGLWVLG